MLMLMLMLMMMMVIGDDKHCVNLYAAKTDAVAKLMKKREKEESRPKGKTTNIGCGPKNRCNF